MPVWRVIDKTFLAEILIDPQYQDPKTKAMVDQEINWAGVPNQSLLPLTDSAKEVHREYLLSISRKPIDESKLAAPWVMSAGKILRGRSGIERAGEQPAMGIDPRRMGPAQQKTKAVLGSTAAPAVMGH